MEDPTSGSPNDALRISGRVVYPIRSSPDGTSHVFNMWQFVADFSFYSFHALRHTATPEMGDEPRAEFVARILRERNEAAPFGVASRV